MKGEKTRQTKQRETILSIIRSTHAHPTAEEVYHAAREIIPDISLGTVYRNLNQLAAHDDIHKVISDHQVAHYDGNLKPHAHFICQTCGRIYDVAYDEEKYQDLINDAKHIGVVHHAKMTLIGLCLDCAKTKEVNTYDKFKRNTDS